MKITLDVKWLSFINFLRQIGYQLLDADVSNDGTELMVNGDWRYPDKAWPPTGVMITYIIGDELVMSLPDDPQRYWGRNLAVLEAALSQFLGASASCQFDTAESHHVIWTLADEQEKLAGIVSNTLRFHNFILFGGRKREDFVDAELEGLYNESVAKHKRYHGVHGLDPAMAEYPRIMKATNFGLFLEYNITLSTIAGMRYTPEEYFATLEDEDEDEDDFAEDSNLLERDRRVDVNAIVQELYEQGLQEEVDELMMELDFITCEICERNHIEVYSTNQLALEIEQEKFDEWYDFYQTHLERLILDGADPDAIVQAYSEYEDMSAYEPAENWQG